MPICVYCGRDKLSGELSKEHVIPQSITGRLDPCPFVIRNVCERCNNLCGMFVDEPFTKSYLVNNLRARCLEKYVDLTSDPVLPLVYYGVLKQMTFRERLCEVWSGPTGDSIYHFHLPYPNTRDLPPIAGEPSCIRKEVDHGFAFLFFRSNNPRWHPTILESYRTHFRRTTKYVANAEFTGAASPFPDIPPDLVHLTTQLRGLQKHEINLSIDPNYGARFLAKLALGLGSLLLSDEFVASEDANLLRRFLWARCAEDRYQIPMRGCGFLSASEKLAHLQPVMSWPGGHVVCVLCAADMLVLFVSFYESQMAEVLISSNPSHWKGQIQDEGIVFVVMPGLGKSVGPIDMAEYISHSTESDYSNPLLSALEREMDQCPPLPPYVI